VTAAIAGPTAVRHANATFSGESGAWRSTDASAAGITCCSGIIRARYHYWLRAQGSGKKTRRLEPYLRNPLSREP